MSQNTSDFFYKWPISLHSNPVCLRRFSKQRFQNTLGITRARPSGLLFWVNRTDADRVIAPTNAPYRAYLLASLGYANWILRRFGYKAAFIFGFGVGALLMYFMSFYEII